MIKNSSGQQIASLWACTTEEHEGISMAKSRAALGKIHFSEGDELLTVKRRPLLRFTKNTRGGLHDNSLPASSAAEAAMRDALRKRGVKVWPSFSLRSHGALALALAIAK